jgi:hypothetical protein
VVGVFAVDYSRINRHWQGVDKMNKIIAHINARRKQTPSEVITLADSLGIWITPAGVVRTSKPDMSEKETEGENEICFTGKDMKNYILILEHLSYILECFCIPVWGEAKIELDNLKEELLNDHNFKIENGTAIVNRLNQASELLHSDDCYEAGSILSSVSNNLWKKVMEQINENLKLKRRKRERYNMTLHIHYTHQCKQCSAYYIPFEQGVACPKCGINEEEVYAAFISEAAVSARFNLQSGSYIPAAWIVSSSTDRILRLLFSILEKHRTQNDQKPFAEVACEFVEKTDFGEYEYLREHLCQLAVKVKGKLDEFKG